MSRTISTTLTAGITLTGGDNPVTVTCTGRITAGGAYGIYGPGGAGNSWTVSNYGTIIGSGSSSVEAVGLGSSSSPVSNGVFINRSGGRITSTHNEVVIEGSGTVTNMAGGTIISTDTGAASVVYTAGFGTIVNGGLLQATNVVIYEPSGASVTNLATGTITGTNAACGAVLFNTTTAGSRLIVDPGAVFNGKIISLANSTNVVELASAASAGTLSGFDGSTITNFASLQFDSGAAWTIRGNSTASGLGSIAITGFAQGDTIDVKGFVAVSKTFAGNALTLTNAGNATPRCTFREPSPPAISLSPAMGLAGPTSPGGLP